MKRLVPISGVLLAAALVTFLQSVAPLSLSSLDSTFGEAPGAAPLLLLAPALRP